MSVKNCLKNVWLWVFIGLTLFSFIIFVLLTADSLIYKIPKRTNADNLTEEVIAGKKAFQKYNCNDCHIFSGIGAYYAPDLTKVYKKYGDGGRELMKDIIMNPENYFGKSSTSIFDFTRRMQKPHVKKIKFISRYNPYFTLVKEYITIKETERIMDFLKWVSEIDNNDWPPTYSNKYQVGNNSGSSVSSLFKDKNCSVCHKYNGVGGDFGPGLNKVSIREEFKNMEDLKNFIEDPKSYNDDSSMPPYGNAEFTEEELDELVESLWEGK